MTRDENGEAGFPEYRSLVSDWDAFQRSLCTPRPEALRVNGLKMDPQELVRHLDRRGVGLRSSPWFPSCFYWEDSSRPASSTLLHWNGSYYIQDPVTLLPVDLLELQQGETVLDLCAAPGGKALHMAESTGETGCVVANEPVPGRRITLGANIQRLGACNLAVTAYDGQSFPERMKFPAILVDAPCSGEGTVRKSSRAPRRPSDDRLRELARTQRQLLQKAYRILEPGGRLLYSTCSFAPEENEAVVSQLLQTTGAEVEAMDQPYPHDPGVTRWQGERYHPDVERIWRCYPHHYDGGGLVFARIRRPKAG